METFWSPEPIVGYRVWNVWRDRIAGFHSVWRTPAHRAKCSLPERSQPAPHVKEGCECGIYAAKDTAWLASHFAGSLGPRVAMGRVELTGRVIEHTNGYRAEQAQVAEIAVRTRRGVFHFADSGKISSLFAEPHRTIANHLHDALPVSTDLAALVTERQ